MRIVYLCDANSIHSQNLIRFFAEREHEIVVISTKSCDVEKYAFKNVTLKFLGAAGPLSQPSANLYAKKKIFDIMPGLWTVMAAQQVWLAGVIRPFILKSQAQEIVNQFSPDILHVLRTRYEGYIASLMSHPRIVLSLWGNDIVYWPGHNRMFRYFTKRLLKKVRLLLPDTIRDKYLAEVFDFPKNAKVRVMPATGGIRQSGEIKDIRSFSKDELKKRWNLKDKRVILSCRGFFNWYVKTEAFVRAIPNLLKKNADYFFVIEGNLNSPGFNRINALVKRLGVEDNVVLEHHNRETYLEIVKMADIIVSMAIVDGLPMSLLEAMYLETFPIMCFQRSYDGFFENGKNCMFFCWDSEEEIEACITKYYAEYHTDRKWVDLNRQIMEEKCNYEKNLCRLEGEYQELLDGL